MSVIDTIPAGLEQNIGIFSFGPMNAGNTTFTFLGTQSVGGLNFPGTTNLTSISCPNLVSIDPNDTQRGFFSIQNCFALATLSLPLLSYVDDGMILISGNPTLPHALTSISLPKLVTVAGKGGTSFAFGSTSMTSFSAPLLSFIGGNTCQWASNCNISLPSLVTIGDAITETQVLAGISFLGSILDLPLLQNTFGNITIIGAPNLTTFNAPNWIPRNGKIYIVNTCALNVASVNLILARCVANAAYVSGTVNVGGGANAAPAGQGIVDKATLLGRGVLVSTN